MIKLNGSRFTVAMPENLKEQPEVQAIAYAVGRQIEKLCAYADGARTYAAIQSMPERVLDLLAVELRTPAYDENYSIKVKRALIEGSLLFYTPPTRRSPPTTWRSSNGCWGPSSAFPPGWMKSFWTCPPTRRRYMWPTGSTPATLSRSNGRLCKEVKTNVCGP